MWSYSALAALDWKAWFVADLTGATFLNLLPKVIRDLEGTEDIMYAEQAAISVAASCTEFKYH